MHPGLTELLRDQASALGLRPPARTPLRPVRRGLPGDWSSPLAHALATPERGAEDIARALAVGLAQQPDLVAVRAEAGTLVLTLSTTALAAGARQLLEHRPSVAAGAESSRRSPQRPPDDRRPEDPWPAELEPVALAHARCRNVTRAARAHGVRSVPGEQLETALTAVVEQEPTRDLLVHLGAFAPARPVSTAQHPPGAVAEAPAVRDPGTSVLLRDLAECYQDFYARTRTAPRGTEPVTSTHRTYLTLTEATAVALAAGLSALGLPAPEHL